MHYILDLSEQIILHTVVNLYEIDGEDVCTCFQDLPEHFEDNIKTWMDNFLQLLSADNKLLKTEVCIVQQECCCNFQRACLYIWYLRMCALVIKPSVIHYFDSDVLPVCLRSEEWYWLQQTEADVQYGFSFGLS